MNDTVLCFKFHVSWGQSAGSRGRTHTSRSLTLLCRDRSRRCSESGAHGCLFCVHLPLCRNRQPKKTNQQNGVDPNLYLVHPIRRRHERKRYYRRCGAERTRGLQSREGRGLLCQPGGGLVLQRVGGSVPLLRVLGLRRKH